MARVELSVQAPDFIPPQSTSHSAKKRGLQTARDVAYFDFIPTERSTLDDFNGKSVSLSDFINRKNYQFT